MTDEAPQGVDMQRIVAQSKEEQAKTERLHEDKRRAANNLHLSTIGGKAQNPDDVSVLEGRAVENRMTRHIPSSPVKK